jgi:hypothetical protein
MQENTTRYSERIQSMQVRDQLSERLELREQPRSKRGTAARQGDVGDDGRGVSRYISTRAPFWLHNNKNNIINSK